MVSYAQNYEDVVLARAFHDVACGFWIDVGAMHPTWDSVTKHFYDRGWSGINVEPSSAHHALLVAERPRDTNLRVALGSAPGRAVLHHVAETGLSSLDAAVIESATRDGRAVVDETVEVTTLAAICREHVRGEVDFLKVDVEGHEAEVLRGGDWARFRPRVVLVESTRPNSTEQVHGAWEPILLEAEYRFALFDGLNRFYARSESPELMERLAAPANVLDHWISHRTAIAEARVAHLEEKHARWEAKRPKRILARVFGSKGAAR